MRDTTTSTVESLQDVFIAIWNLLKGIFIKIEWRNYTVWLPLKIYPPWAVSREQNWFALYWQFSTFYSWQKKVKGHSYFYVFKKSFCACFLFVSKVSCYHSITSLCLLLTPKVNTSHLAKLKLTARKNLHITVVIRHSVRPPQTLALIYSDPDKKSAILGHAPWLLHAKYPREMSAMKLPSHSLSA